MSRKEKSRLPIARSPGVLSKEVATTIAQARRAIIKYDSGWTTALANTDDRLFEALKSLYAVCLAFDRQPKQRDAYLESAKIAVHGNTRNRFQPVIRALLKGCHVELRKRATKYAGVVAFAMSEDISAGEFKSFVRRRHGGLEAAYRTYVKQQRIPREQLRRLKERKAIVDRFVQTGSNISFPCTAQMEGRSGIALAVVDIADGHFRVLRVLDHRPEEIERLLEPQAQRWATSQARQA